MRQQKRESVVARKLPGKLDGLELRMCLLQDDVGLWAPSQSTCSNFKVTRLTTRSPTHAASPIIKINFPKLTLLYLYERSSLQSTHRWSKSRRQWRLGKDMAGDDYFSDDELDIPDNTLQELERNAISSTQRSKPIDSRAPAVVRKQIRGIAPLNRAGSANRNLPWRPPQPRSQAKAAPRASIQCQNAPPPSAPEPPSSDYGLDDGDVIDLREPSAIVEPASKPYTRPPTQLRPSAAAAAIYGSRAGPNPETEAAYALADAELGIPHNAGQWSRAPSVQPQVNNGADVSSLHARVAELEAQQLRLQQLEQEARNAALAKQGEIAIVRANQEKWAKEYERKIAVMQKVHANDTAKHKAELEAARKEREKVETNNHFLQHDLAQEADRAKRLNGPGRTRAAPAAAKQNETPRKANRTNLGDGFNDDEALVPSPSKSKERSRDQTPKAGVKRKRTAQDSPIAALSFTQPQQPVRQAPAEHLQPSMTCPISASVRADHRFEFMQRLLNHRPHEGHDRSIETLAKHFFPSKPSESLSSILMNEIASSPISADADRLPLKLSRVSLRLWARCLAEQHFAPLYLILDTLRFALYFELSSVVSAFIEEAMPLCIRTAELVATPRASTTATFTANIDWHRHQQLVEQIDVDEIMDFLQRLCEASSLTDDRLNVFWQRMEPTFTLLMLNKAQPINQITTNLHILATSALPTSFATIAVNAVTHVKQEGDMIDRLTSLLNEMPEVPEDEPPYTEKEIAALRLEILEVFKAMCLTDHGGLLLAQHRSAMGRLVRFLDGQINKLYLLPLNMTSASAGDDKGVSAHELVSNTVNQTTRLIHHLLHTHEDSIDISQKLQVIYGGYHKFLISMTRLAFSEQLVFERGIEDDVVTAAHAILDNVLSPEEGEAIVMAVETPRGTKGTGVNVRMEEEDGDVTMSEPG